MDENGPKIVFKWPRNGPKVSLKGDSKEFKNIHLKCAENCNKLLWVAVWNGPK